MTTSTVQGTLPARSDVPVALTWDLSLIFATDEAWEHLLGRFDAARVAAVAVRIDGDNPLPEALLRAADAQAVPLITFPSEAVLADVTTAVLDALLDAQGRRLERILDAARIGG